MDLTVFYFQYQSQMIFERIFLNKMGIITMLSQIFMVIVKFSTGPSLKSKLVLVSTALIKGILLM